MELMVVEVVVTIVPTVLGAFPDVLYAFLGILDGSVLAFLSLCYVINRQGIRRRIHFWFQISYNPFSTNSCR
jgi:hypothetical protein